MSAVGEEPPPAHRHVPLHPAQPRTQPQPGGGRVGARRARAAAPAGGGGRRGGGPVRGARAVRGVRARLQQLRPVSARAGGQRPGRLQLPGTPGPGTAPAWLWRGSNGSNSPSTRTCCRAWCWTRAAASSTSPTLRRSTACGSRGSGSAPWCGAMTTRRCTTSWSTRPSSTWTSCPPPWP